VSSASSSLSGFRARLAAARRIVVKVGTNVVMRDDGTPSTLALGRLYGLVESVGALRRQGKEVLLVSSGAVGLGAQRLALKEKPKVLALKQACAAVGQSRLMSVYEHGFEKLGLTTAQVLLTEEDFTSRTRYLNLRATLEKLLELGTVPILNENDTVSTQELEGHVFGDNDKLSALVASKLDAQLLVILSDVDALYTANPARSRAAERVSLVAELTPEVEAYADGGGARGRGGMATKLQAARIATSSGCMTVIASGRLPGVLERLFAGEDLGTLFLPSAPMPGKRRWLAWASAPAGTLVVNDGARAALLRKKASLLPAGVVSVHGSFRKGDVVSIQDAGGVEIARGIASRGDAEAARLAGAPERGVELVHRDNILIVAEET